MVVHGGRSHPLPHRSLRRFVQTYQRRHGRGGAIAALAFADSSKSLRPAVPPRHPERNRAIPGGASSSERRPCAARWPAPRRATSRPPRTRSRSCRRHVCGSRASSCASASAAARAVPGGHDAVGEPDRQRLGGADRAAVRIKVHRAADADEARQPDGAAVDQRHAPAPAEDAEDRRLLGDAQVAPERELEPACHRVPGDGRDHRLAERRRVGPSARRRRRSTTRLPSPAPIALRSAPAQNTRDRRRGPRRGPRGRRRRRGRLGQRRGRGPSTALRVCGAARITVQKGPLRSIRTGASFTTGLARRSRRRPDLAERPP